MDTDWILVRYGELGLKSDQVRERFEYRLMDNIRAGLKEEDIDGKVKRGYGRIFVKTGETGKASQVLPRIFGIHSFSPCIKIETDLGEIVKEAGRIGEEIIESDETFAVRARRTGEHDFTSKDIEEETGTEIIKRKDAEVDLDDPDKTVWVEVRQDSCYLFTEKIDGPGGMPLGTQGSVISLFKGDCRSFLATWFLMKRGCSVALLHGDISPYRSERKVKKAFKELKKWDYGEPLELIKFDFGEELFQFEENATREFICILCRRFLIKLASKIASQGDFKAMVSGEASDEPFRNFKIEDLETSMPVLRPLVGFTKEEIRRTCKAIGGDPLLKKEECKAKKETTGKVSEEEIKNLEEKLNFEGALEEKFKAVMEDENS